MTTGDGSPVRSPEQLHHSGGDWTSDFGSAGTGGNISADPLYCDAAGGGYTIHSDSPCAPGATFCGLIGALPVGCGVVSLDRLSWGRIKNAYR